MAIPPFRPSITSLFLQAKCLKIMNFEVAELPLHQNTMIDVMKLKIAESK